MGSHAARRFAPLLVVAGVLATGCGASAPLEADIYHDPALRPGVVAADAADQELLSRLAEPEIATPIVVSGRSYSVEASYDAASGRRCRGVLSSGERRLACETADASWVFVPDIVRARSGR